MNGLSICVPVYNFNCIESIKALCEQIENLDIKAEVLVIDDASKVELTELKNFDNQYYYYEKLNQNIGRSKIRNLLGGKANFNHILFIDGDSGIPENFTKTYIQHIEKHPNSVICGGRIHKLFSNSKKSLRYNYGVKYEDTKASDRQIKSYNAFMTNNFVVPKQILKNIPFNEELNQYGHEDTFFGFELEKNKVPILHIDNPVIHLELESNTEYLQKTKQAIQNLVILKKQYPEFIKHTTLLNTAKRFMFLKVISSFFSKLFENISEKTGSPSSFQLFKLFYLISINHQK